MNKFKILITAIVCIFYVICSPQALQAMQSKLNPLTQTGLPQPIQNIIAEYLDTVEPFTMELGDKAGEIVNVLTLSPEGRYALILTNKKTKKNSSNKLSVIMLWDLARNQLHKVLKGHTETIKEAVFSPDESMLITLSRDRTFRVWDINSGACLRVIPEQDYLSINSLSPDGTIAVLGRTLEVVNPLTGQSLGAIPKFNKLHHAFVACCPNSPYIVTVESGSVRMAAEIGSKIAIWDVNTKKCLHHFDLYRVSKVPVVSPNGTMIASIVELDNSRDQYLKIWDVPSGKELTNSKIKLGYLWHCDIVFSPKGTYCALKNENTLYIITVATGKVLIKVLKPYYHAVHRYNTRTIEALNFSPDEQILHLLTDSGEGAIKLTIKAGEIVSEQEVELGDDYYPAQFSSNGNYIIPGGETEHLLLKNQGLELKQLITEFFKASVALPENRKRKASEDETSDLNHKKAKVESSYLTADQILELIKKSKSVSTLTIEDKPIVRYVIENRLDCLPALKYLIKHHSALFKQQDATGQNSIHAWAITPSYYALLTLFKDKSYLDELINSQDNNGNTPLHLVMQACLAKQVKRAHLYKKLERLAQQHARTDIYNHKAVTAFDIADELKDGYIRRAFLKRLEPQADTSADMSDEDTDVVMAPAPTPNSAVIQRLIEKGRAQNNS